MNWKALVLAAAVALFIAGCSGGDNAGPKPQTGAEGSKGATGEGYNGPKPSFGTGAGGATTTGGGAGTAATTK